MLEWQAPWFLLLLLALPALAWWRRRRRPSWGFSSLALQAGGGSIRRRLAVVPDLALLLGLGCLVVALARPQETRETVVRSDGIDIMLALDISGSMEAPDFRIGGRRASRLDVAKAVLHRFIQARPDDRLGLVVFGEEAFTQVPLTMDHEALSGFLAHVDIGMAGSRATAIGDALGVSARRMAALDAPARVVVLLTDGQNNAGSISPTDAAQAAAALGIRVHTVGVGAEGGTRFGLLGRPSSGDLDEEVLQGMAAQTGGRYFRATDAAGLEEVYATIDEMEKSTAESTVYVHRDELYRLPLALGLALLLLELTLSATWLRRLP